MNKVAKVFVNLIVVILIAVILILSIYAVQVSFMKKEFANLFGFSIFQVETGSMEPIIASGDIIIVKLKKEVEQNDIITYRAADGRLITHRVIKKEENQLITKGDYNNSEDAPISYDQVLGEVVFVFRNVEIWKKVITTPVVLISIVITIVLYGIAFSYEEEKKEKSEESR